jgi:hypothetical protein
MQIASRTSFLGIQVKDTRKSSKKLWMSMVIRILPFFRISLGRFVSRKHEGTSNEASRIENMATSVGDFVSVVFICEDQLENYPLVK